MSPGRPPAAMAAEPSKKPLDPLVKTALAICIGLIVITLAGMILTAPDRSIPPYSVLAQQGESVTVNVPPHTTDLEVEALLVRFQAAGHGDRAEFARLKIKPTTPDDPAGRYRRLTIYIFDNAGLAEETSLKDYLAGADRLARSSFERGVRGTYRLADRTEFGALGPPSDARVLFEGRTDREAGVREQGAEPRLKIGVGDRP